MAGAFGRQGSRSEQSDSGAAEDSAANPLVITVDKAGALGIAFAFFIAMVGTTLPTPLYPLYTNEYGWSPLTVTIVFALYALAVAGGLLLFGHQSDRAGRRPVLIAGLLLSALSAVAFLFMHGLTVALIGRVLSGISAGIFTGAGTAAVVDFAPPEKRRAFALGSVIANVGGLGAGTLIAGVLAEYTLSPLRVPYAVDLVLLIPALWCVLSAPEMIPNANGRFTFTVQHLRVPENVRTIFWQASIAGICAFAVSGVFSAVAPVYLATQLHVHAPLAAGLLVFVLMEVSALGQLVVDRLPKRFAFTIGCIFMIGGLAALAEGIAARSEALLFVASALGGFGQGIVMGFGLANINEHVTERRGEVTSAYFVLLYAGLAVPVVAVGLLVRPLGLQTAGLIFCGVVAATVAAVVIADLATMQRRNS